MIDDRSPSFPVGVLLRGQEIYDSTLGEAYPLNESAHVLLQRVNARSTAAEIASSVSRQAGFSSDDVLRGTRALFGQLNAAHLLNLGSNRLVDELGYYSAVFQKLIGFPVVPQSVKVRMPIRDRILSQIAHAVWMAFRLPILLVAGVICAAAILAGFTWLPLAFALGLYLSLVVHEYGHALVLRANGYKYDQMYLVVSVGRLAVARKEAPEEVEISVGLGGPGLALLPGFVLMLLGHLTHIEEFYFAGVPFICQILTLLPMFDDNRIVWRTVQRLRKLDARKVGLDMSGVIRGLVQGLLLAGSVYVCMIILSVLLAIGSDVSGLPSYTLGFGSVRFFSFEKQVDSFHGSLGGGAFWLAVTLAAVQILLGPVLRGRGGSNA